METLKDENDFSTIIVNWNQSQQTIGLVHTMLQNKITTPIVVFDNNSKDKNALATLSSFKNVILIYSDKNVGYGQGINEAYHSQNLSSYPFLFLLNQDIAFDHSVMEKLLKGMKQNAKLAVTGPLLLERKGDKDVIYSGGRNISKYLNTRIELDQDIASSKWIDVDYIPGTFFLTRTSVIEQPFLDNRYFFGGEIADYCAGLNSQYEIQINTSCQISHKFNKMDPVMQSYFKAYYNLRNRFIYASKYNGIKSKLRWIFKGVRMSFGSFFRLNLSLFYVYNIAIVDGLLGRFGNANEKIIKFVKTP